MTSLRVVIQGDNQSDAAFRKVIKQTKEAKTGFKGLLGTLRDVTIVGTGLTRALKSIAGAMAGTIEATKEQTNAELRLALGLQKVTGNIKENFLELRKFAQLKQDSTTFTRTFILNLAAIGATFGLTVETIKEGIDGVIDRSFAVRRGATELFRIFARFGGGATDTMGELGERVDPLKTRLENLEQAAKNMRTGLAEAVAKLPTGLLAQFGNQLIQLRQDIGKIIVSTGTFQVLLGALKSVVVFINNAIDGTDTERLRSIIEFIDGIVIAIIRMAAVVIRSLTAVGTMVARTLSAVRKLPFFGATQEEIKAIKKWEAQWDSAQETIKGLEPFFKVLTAQQSDLLAGAQALKREAATNLAVLGVMTDDLAIGATEVANWFDQIAEEIEQAKTSEEGLLAILQLLKSDLRTFFDRLAGDPIGDLVDSLKEVGQPFADALTLAMQEAFDEDVGITEAFENLGKNAKDIFIGQFSEQAFSPLKATFGKLAATLAAPFNVLGNVINKILAPITNVITKIISTLITEFLTIIGLQELMTLTGIASVAAVNTAASTMAATWGAAAIAASIATLGAALSAAPAAQAAITAGAAATKALAIGAAEGGFFSSRPGGHFVNLGEGGEGEFVVPESKMMRLLERLAGGQPSGAAGVNIEGDLVVGGSVDDPDRLAENIGLALLEARAF